MRAELEPPPRAAGPRRRTVAITWAVLTLLACTAVAALVLLARSGAVAAAAPPPVYPGAVRTDTLPNGLTVYATQAPFKQVEEHYLRRLGGMASPATEQRYVLFAGPVERLYLAPARPDPRMDQVLFLHHGMRSTTWTFLARAKTGTVTRILTGRVPDRRPPNVSIVASTALLNDMWGPVNWAGSGCVAVGGVVAGTCSLPAAFAENWSGHAAVAGVFTPYAPGLSSVTSPPASANGSLRPAVYWCGDEAEGFRLALFERFNAGQTTLEFLCAAPGEKNTRFYLANFLN